MEFKGLVLEPMAPQKSNNNNDKKTPHIIMGRKLTSPKCTVD